MRFTVPHAWNVSPAEAREIQSRLRDEVIDRDDFGEVSRVAGVDVGFEDSGRTTRAAIAILSYPELELIESSIARVPTAFPYVPGLLTFREGPAVLAAFDRLKILPDLVLYDGQGLAHPRRFGIACHLGVLTGLPSIGVAKSRLVGTFDEPGAEKGDWSTLKDGNEVIGRVLRTRTQVSCVYVSVGHRIKLPAACDWVINCVTRFRLPETTRWAHRLASG